MGKESKLRNKEPDHPYVARDGNGIKLPYDPDRCPDGLDPRIWLLTLYFEQKLEDAQVSSVGRPIIYVSLSRRLDNTGLSVLRAHARTCGLADWVSLLRSVIDVYFDTPTDSILSVDNFTKYEMFEYCLQYAIDSYARSILLEEGTKVDIPQQQRQPSKRTEAQAVSDRIRQKKYTDDEVASRKEKFRNRGSE